MKKYCLYIFTGVFMGCGQPDNTSSTPGDTTILIPADTVSSIREKVNTNPVADYTEPVPDPLNDWHFAVSLYETKKTFEYKLRVQYKELRISDPLSIPDFGTMPQVSIHKGKDPLSCIVGFLDKKGQFKEYKLVRIKGDQLKITTINNYYIGSYKTKQ